MNSASSEDQSIVNTTNNFPSGYVCEGSHLCFHGRTVFWDAETGIICIDHQVSLKAGDTMMENISYEEWLWEKYYSETKHLYSDNSSHLICSGRIWKKNNFLLSVALVHNTKTPKQRMISKKMYMSCTFMINVLFHWSEHGVGDISLCYFAVNHTVWIYNRATRIVARMTPMDTLKQNKTDNKYLICCHIWSWTDMEHFWVFLMSIISW